MERKSIESLSLPVKQRMKDLKLTQVELANHTGLGLKTVRAVVLAAEGTSIKNWLIVLDSLGLKIKLVNKI